ncbi:stimulus-sensing domain-containing protein [Thalassospira lucentensis]|jgi:two-component system sensor histidine kinase ChvG|uniref:stimulus-sensing domain-containing protein n=1 Tax=Thalassospira lucentensis TaxID=168935 RepID=UPI0003B6BE0E|nr:stimulus-sensing domain-containing protein [Thalassospira lucentensis]RCK26935.1 histidine kinase [Thalassospira lucentensis MCCC 1A00383 = DSM 14000]
MSDFAAEDNDDQTTVQHETRTARIEERHGLFSPLTWRILAVNALALFVLVAGILYLGRYKQELIHSELEAMAVQAEMYAAALSTSAVSSGDDATNQVKLEVAREMVRRLVGITGARTRLFAVNGNLIADSRNIKSFGAGTIQAEELPAPGDDDFFAEVMRNLTDGLLALFEGDQPLPLYVDPPVASAADYPEVRAALAGYSRGVVRVDGQGRRVLSVSVPVARFKQVLASVMMTKSGDTIETALHAVRLDILKIFVFAFGITVLLSIYLAGVITRPLNRLARAAERVRRSKNRQFAIPDLSDRNDEIGDLSTTLRDMTETLWDRMDAIERFAADVAHEIKNPLTSLRSAVETATRLKDPERQRRLMEIIAEDVQRLDRLISDISDYSRMDAELSRTESEEVDLRPLLQTMGELYNANPDGPRIKVAVPENLIVPALESRLTQVFRNLISNAITFTPEGGEVRVRAWRDKNQAIITIEDDGPGIPPGKEEAIFNRFYTERPSTEKFGQHSGLGLSISKRIMSAHNGELSAQNRVLNDEVKGAVFTIRLPLD